MDIGYFCNVRFSYFCFILTYCVAINAEDSDQAKMAKNNEITTCYHNLFKRYQQKKTINTLAASYFSNIDFFCFTLPNVLIQITMAVLPVFLSDKEPETLKRVISTLAAVSAVWMSLSAKLALGKRAERFRNVAKGYSEMCSDAYFKIVEEAFTSRSSGSGSDLEADLEARKKRLIEFLIKVEKVEKLAKNRAPFMPWWIIKRAEKRITFRRDQSQENLRQFQTVENLINQQPPSLASYNDYINEINEGKKRCSDYIYTNYTRKSFARDRERNSNFSSCSNCFCGRPKIKIRAPNFDVF